MKIYYSITVIFSLLLVSSAKCEEDTREFVQLPKMMQQHMLKNMRIN